MGVIGNIWRQITPSNAIERAQEFERLFFEDVYRVMYAVGLSTTDRTIPYLIYSRIVRLAVAMIVCGEIWYAFTEVLSLDEMAACINVIVIHLITVCKLKNMSDYRDVYKKLAMSMETSYFDISTENRLKLMTFWADIHAKYIKLLLELGNCTLAAWHVYPLVDELEYNLMVDVHLPFHYNTPLRYCFTYLVVGITFIYASHFVMVTDLAMLAHLVPLICQLAVLADCFENIEKDCSEGFEDVPRNNLAANNDYIKKYLGRLGKLVEQHKLILNYTMDLRAILSGPMLGQLAASGVLICFVSYQASTTVSESITKFLMSLLYLGYNMFSLYVICRLCEEITLQCENIGRAVYCSGWENGVTVVPEVRSTIVLVIARANKPVVFNAGGMYDLSLSSFSTLVKSSYSALTVLLRLRHD